MNGSWYVQEDTAGTKYLSRFGTSSTGSIETLILIRKLHNDYEELECEKRWCDHCDQVMNLKKVSMKLVYRRKPLIPEEEAEAESHEGFMDTGIISGLKAQSLTVQGMNV